MFIEFWAIWPIAPSQLIGTIIIGKSPRFLQEKKIILLGAVPFLTWDHGNLAGKYVFKDFIRHN